jgi:starch-binding outer membrane protein, SusD/RagB family
MKRQYLKYKAGRVTSLCLGVALLFSACKKMVEADLPIDQLTSQQVFRSTNTAVLAMNGIYAKLAAQGSGGIPDMSINLGLLADELKKVTPTVADKIYSNNLDGKDNTGDFWNSGYRSLIYGLNSIIEGLNHSESIPHETRQILLGEAKFTRAFIYFYLVGFYGDIPLVLTLDFKINSNIARTNTTIVYEQIIKDLLEAKTTLSDHYLGIDLVTSTEERVRPTKAAASALLAQVYLYTGEWLKAEQEASNLIADANFALLPLNDVFLKNSKETIWQLQPNTQNFGGTNTGEGRAFLHNFINARLGLNAPLLNAFEAGDKRRVFWVVSNAYQANTYFFPYKYKVGNGDQSQPQTEYEMVFRLAEQYLIRAEARARQGKLTGVASAQEDLNVIRTRAGLSGTTATTQTDMLDAILHERRVELFTELGHRWLDLKRYNKIDEVMSVVAPQKGGTWFPWKALLPIPVTEFKYNAALRGHQNPGYPEQ